MKKIFVLIAGVFLMSCSSQTVKKEFFIFEPDERLFASYAFMNAAGFDFDWHEAHPVRTEIRQYLDSVLTENYKIKIKEYYEKQGGGNFYAYGAYALQCNNPPDFAFKGDTIGNEDLQKFYGYELWLKEFYEAANISELWARYKDVLREINNEYAPYADMALRQITHFCRTDTNYFQNNVSGHFYYQRIPLMSHSTGFYTESGNDCWIVYGPAQDGEKGPGAFYHESLHKVINPIIFDNTYLNKKLKELLPLSQEKLAGDYDDLDTMISESFVRAIDRFLANQYYNEGDKDKLYELMENEYSLGHILCFYIMEAIPEYIESDMTFSEYYPVLISRIDVDKEIKRWRNYWSDKNNIL